MNHKNSSHYLENLRIEVEKTKQSFIDNNLDSKSFCIMPFVNITLEPGGEVGICRHKGSDFTFGNIKNKNIDEIWSSPDLVKWREELKNGNPVVCKNELIDQKCNMCPELNKLMPHAEINNVKNPKILRLTANLNGKCNLQCQMCNVWKLPNGFYTDENFWIPARKRFFKEIKEVDMLSGEPFIQPDTYRLIDEISSVNPGCLWSITTNAHWKLSESIKSYLDKISVKNLIVSIDSLIPEIYHKIRYPGDLKIVLTNLDMILDYQQQRINSGRGSLNIRMNFLVQQDNYKEIPKILNFCREKEITPFVTFLYRPGELSLLSLSEERRVEILEHYFENFSREELLLSLRVLKPLMRSLSKIEYARFLCMSLDRGLA